MEGGRRGGGRGGGMGAVIRWVVVGEMERVYDVRVG